MSSPSATSWAKGLWVVALLIGLLDAYRWHKGAAFGYDTQHVWQAAHAILHGRSSWNQFVYPPGCLLFAFPFAALPFRVARLLMYGAVFLSIVYLFWSMTRLIRMSLGSSRVAGLAVALTLVGQLGIAAHYENFTILLVPLAAAFFLAVDRERPMAAAVVLGVSLTIKPLLLPLLLVLLLRRLWRETVVALAIPVVLSVIVMGIVLVANADPSGFVHEVEHTFSSNNSRPWNMSLNAMAGYLQVPHAVATVARVLVGGASLFACWRIWRRPVRDAGDQAIWLTAPLFVILILCFSFAWASTAFSCCRSPLSRCDRIVRPTGWSAWACSWPSPPTPRVHAAGLPGHLLPERLSGDRDLRLGTLINGAVGGRPARGSGRDASARAPEWPAAR